MSVSTLTPPRTPTMRPTIHTVCTMLPDALMKTRRHFVGVDALAPPLPTHPASGCHGPLVVSEKNTKVSKVPRWGGTTTSVLQFQFEFGFEFDLNGIPWN